MDGGVSLVVTQSGVCLVLQEVFHTPKCTTAILPKFVEIQQTWQHIMEDKTFALLHKEHSLSLQVLCCSLVERCAAIHILLVHLTSNPNQCEHTWILTLSSCIVQGNPILCILQLEVGTTADEEIQAVNWPLEKMHSLHSVFIPAKSNSWVSHNTQV